MNARDSIRAVNRLPRTLLALPSCLALAFCGSAASAATTQPALSPSTYEVSALCSAPAAEHARCLGLRLIAKEPLAQPGARELPSSSSAVPDATVSGTPIPAAETKKPAKGALSPANVLSAYNLSGVSPPSSQTIALVDAYDDATAEADLETFSSQYGLPACNEANGCFRKVNQAGNRSPLPASSGVLERGWALEIATDIETAHGVCPSCRILLVEAKTNSNANLFAAEATAGNLGATEISNSWGAEEPSSDNAAFNRPGIVITASAGDDGYLNWLEGSERFAEYPATSPHVVAVGGTRLILTAAKAWEQESVWNDGGQSGGTFDGHGAAGGGCSVPFTAAPWQQSVAGWPAVGCGTHRAVADVSADADPYTGVSVYDSTEEEHGNKGWAAIGGTSVASPIIASTFALAGGAQGAPYPARILYENLTRAPGSLHDVIAGSNGECLRPFHESSGVSGCTTAEQAASCSGASICTAAPGYDGPTGVGTPNGIGAFLLNGPPPAEPAIVAAPPLAPAAPAPTGTSSPGAGAAVPATPILSALSLTRNAIAALKRSRPKLSKVQFAFTLNVSTHVKVTIAKRVRVRHRLQWKALAKPITILAPRGRQSRTLSSSGALPQGQYQLTLTPERGVSRSLVFKIS
jgi:hypothetical protein